MNPLRWSGDQTFAKTLADLEKAKAQESKTRPIILKIPANTFNEKRFDTFEEAIAYLRRSDPASQREAEPAGPLRIAVLGLGAFGTAMAHLAARNGNSVLAFCRDPEQREAINTRRRNPKAKTLEDFEIHKNITAVGTVKEACEGASIIMHALPAQKTPEFIKEHLQDLPRDAVFCTTSKGLYLKDRCLLSEAILKAFDDPKRPLAVLSGPSFAKQIMENNPTLVIVASEILDHAERVQRALSGPTFRVYTSQDRTGVELGGALKNPLAIGAGMIEGMGLGINTMAAYLTRANGELRKLVVAMNGRPDTVNGLSGIGDLMLTAFGDLSRNRTCGKRLSKGEKLEDILADATVEGVPTAEVAMHFAKEHNLELPIFSTVAGILDGSIKLEEAGQRLMCRPLGREGD